VQPGKKLALRCLACALALGLCLASGAWAGYRYALGSVHIEQRGAELIDHGEHLALLIGRATVEARNAKDANRCALDEWREYRLAVDRRDIERRSRLDDLDRAVSGHLAGIGAIGDGIDGDYDLAVRCLGLVDELIAGIDELRASDAKPP